jgi:hypothetical protein
VTKLKYLNWYLGLFSFALPQCWLNGITKPIYKNKGDVKDPKNYRPITIVSYWYISQNEIFKCIKKLKNNKACGENEIINEYIKFTSNRFIHI